MTNEIKKTMGELIKSVETDVTIEQQEYVQRVVRDLIIVRNLKTEAVKNANEALQKVEDEIKSLSKMSPKEAYEYCVQKGKKAYECSNPIWFATIGANGSC